LRDRITTSTRCCAPGALNASSLFTSEKATPGLAGWSSRFELQLHVGAVVARFEEPVFLLESNSARDEDGDDELTVQGGRHAGDDTGRLCVNPPKQLKPGL